MNYKVPGVYVERRNYTPMPEIDTRCLTGFVGIAERGDINKPVYIKSFTEYQEHFGGFDTKGKLPASICGFFQNGGEECIVVRVADESEAAKADFHIKSGDSVSTLTALSPGEWGNKIRISLWRETNDSFSLTLKCGKKVENFIHLSYDKNDERYFESYINEHSSLAVINTEGKVESFEPILMSSFSGGNDGLAHLNAGHFIGSYRAPDKYSGLGTFEHYDEVSMIAAPDICNLSTLNDKFEVQYAMVEQAEKFYNRFAVLDVPEELDVSDACEWANLFDSSFASIYYPQVNFNKPIASGGGSTVIPASGLICGMIAGLDKEKGIYVPPAGMVLSGVNSMSKKLSMAEQEMLFSNKVNFFRSFTSKGTKVWGCRTLSSDTDWKNINVRRTFNRICKFLKDETRWAVFEPNNSALRKRIVRFVTGFLINLWKKGYLAGSNTDEAFSVRCDDELNPPENIEHGLITFEVSIAIVRPLEFFKITFSADQSGSNVYFEANE